LGYVGNSPAEKYASFAVQHFTTSATTGYTLSHAVANENDIRLVINNVVQQPGASYAYVASGTTLTLSAATSGTDTMYCVFLGKAVQTVVPPESSITGAMLSDTVISGQSALGATPADTDEFLVSDAGVLKRVDYSYIKASTTDEFRPNAQALIINGSMAVAQRGTSTASITGGGFYTADRFGTNNSGAFIGTWTQTQESLSSGDAFNDGFAKSLKMDNTTANASPAANSQCRIDYNFEGQDLQLLKHGTASAEKTTLSFWIKATKTGTNIVKMYKPDADRSCSIAYTVSTTDTWEYKVLNFPADTSGAVIANDNTTGIQMSFGIAMGSNFTSGTLATTWAADASANAFVGQVNNADNTSNNWEITGVQLEVGEYTSSTIPPFQHETYGDNLFRCQRYYFKNNTVSASMPFASGVVSGTTNSRAVIFYPQPMRSPPTLDKSSSTDFKVFCGSTNVDSTNVAFYYPNNYQALLYVDVSSGLTNGQGAVIIDDGGGNAFIEGNAEL